MLSIHFEKIKFYLDSTPHVMGSLLGIIIVCLILFFWDYCSIQKSKQEEVIGYISYKKKEIRRKADSGVVWMDADDKQPLTRRDTIRAEDLAEAVIKLNDGTEIRLDANSMVILDYSENETKVNLVQGAIRVNKQGSKPLKSLQITSGTNSLTLLEDGDINLKENNKELSLNVTRGNAKLVQDGKEFNVENNQQINIEEGKSPVLKKVSLVIIAPEDQKYITTEETNHNVKFKWTSNKKDGIPVKIEFSNTRDFSKIINSTYVANTEFSQDFLPGSYYWRVVNESDKDSGSIERKFTIVKSESFQVFKPEPNFKIGFLQAPVKVSFQWNTNEMVSKYVLEISNTAEFINLLQKSETNQSNLQLEFKNAGKYFYRFKVYYSNPDLKPKTTEIRSFELEQKKEITAPILTSPRNGDLIQILKGTEENVVFFWKSDKEIIRYILELSLDPSFTNPILKKPVRTDTFSYNSFESEKQYYWRVKGFLDNGGESPYSAIGKFIVKIEDPGNIELIDPSDGKTPELKDSAVEFRWKGYSRSPKYILEIANTPDMSRSLKRNFTDFSFYSEKNLPAGTFYWRVILISREGKEISKSKIFSFIIPEGEPTTPDFRPKVKDHPDTFYVDK